MANALYSDRLIRLTEDSILFRRYYFPFGSKGIEIATIDHVEVLQPTLLSGRWRIHGTGDFRTWFAHDAGRPDRDRIFVLHLRQRWRRIGFTSENSDAVIAFFQKKNIPIVDKRFD